MLYLSPLQVKQDTVHTSRPIFFLGAIGAGNTDFQFPEVGGVLMKM